MGDAPQTLWENNDLIDGGSLEAAAHHWAGPEMNTDEELSPIRRDFPLSDEAEELIQEVKDGKTRFSDVESRFQEELRAARIARHEAKERLGNLMGKKFEASTWMQVLMEHEKLVGDDRKLVADVAKAHQRVLQAQAAMSCLNSASGSGRGLFHVADRLIGLEEALADMTSIVRRQEVKIRRLCDPKTHLAEAKTEVAERLRMAGNGAPDLLSPGLAETTPLVRSQNRFGHAAAPDHSLDPSCRKWRAVVEVGECPAAAEGWSLAD